MLNSPTRPGRAEITEPRRRKRKRRNQSAGDNSLLFARAGPHPCPSLFILQLAGFCLRETLLLDPRIAFFTVSSLDFTLCPYVVEHFNAVAFFLYRSLDILVSTTFYVSTDLTFESSLVYLSKCLFHIYISKGN